MVKRSLEHLPSREASAALAFQLAGSISGGALLAAEKSGLRGLCCSRLRLFVEGLPSGVIKHGLLENTHQYTIYIGNFPIGPPISSGFPSLPRLMTPEGSMGGHPLSNWEHDASHC